MNSKINLLIGLSGSIAAVRILEIVPSFHSLGKFNIKIILTKNAKYFTDSVITNYNEFENTYNTKIYYDDEFEEYLNNKSVVPHIELRKWADCILLAPLSANTLAKITGGLCDNLLTNVLRAWDFSKKGFFCLAMNNLMYEHFLTKKQIDILVNEFKFIQIPSVVKKLKCGDVGIGGIADTKDIVKMVCEGMGISDEIKSKY